VGRELVTTWLLDPKSIALIAGAVVQLVIAVWHSRQTALIVAELVAWRLEVVATLAALETKAEQSRVEIVRLRDLLERT
jgi:hypothetical protein